MDSARAVAWLSSRVGRSLSATVSIGVAVADAADLEKLLAAADEALYRAKQAGRNRFEVS